MPSARHLARRIRSVDLPDLCHVVSLLFVRRDASPLSLLYPGVVTDRIASSYPRVPALRIKGPPASSATPRSDSDRHRTRLRCTVSSLLSEVPLLFPPPSRTKPSLLVPIRWSTQSPGGLRRTSPAASLRRATSVSHRSSVATPPPNCGRQRRPSQALPRHRLPPPRPLLLDLLPAPLSRPSLA